MNRPYITMEDGQWFGQKTPIVELSSTKCTHQRLMNDVHLCQDQSISIVTWLEPSRLPRNSDILEQRPSLII